MAGPVSSQAKVGMEQWPAPDRMAAVRVGHLLANELVAKGAADSRVDWEGGLCLGDLRHTVSHAASHGLVSGAVLSKQTGIQASRWWRTRRAAVAHDREKWNQWTKQLVAVFPGTAVIA